MQSTQIVKKHDVDSAVKVLFKNAGPVFQEQVVKWGAVHADKRRCPHAHILEACGELLWLLCFAVPCPASPLVACTSVVEEAP